MIRPFRGVRYDSTVVGSLLTVVAPPYDIISPLAQRDLHGRSDYNVVRLELGYESPADGPAENRYTRAAIAYRSWLDSGALRPDPNAGFYVYDEEFAQAGAQITRRSFVAPVRLARWEENVVLPHEHTLPKAKADRLQLLTATHTQFSPLLAIYDDPGGVREALAKATSSRPIVELKVEPGGLAAAAATHRLWQLTDADAAKNLIDAFEGLRLYIADGHHRYETALAYRDQRRQAGVEAGTPSDYVLMHLVEANDPGLVVLPTHRLIRGLGPIDRGDVLRRLAETFEIESFALDDPRARTPAFGGRPMLAVLGLAPDRMNRLTVRPDVDLSTLLPEEPAVLRELDTLILQRVVLERVLGFAASEAEAGERIQYTRDPEEAIRAYSSGDAQLVFFLSSTPLKQIREAMRAGARMPQKTTYFYPKPVTGLVFFDHELAWG